MTDVVVLTGAGISTESGIPDYRGPAGLWRADPDYQKLVTIDFYVADPAVRRRSWEFRRDSPAWDAAPNPAHRALVELERAGRLDRLITQNVDGLHRAAGTGAELLLELHGNMWGVACLSCPYRGTLREVLDRIDAGEDDPSCTACGGILKTTTVMFGESLDPDVLAEAIRSAKRCEVFVAIGTSLEVQPAASLAGLAAAAGARLVIVNAEPTPYDHAAAEVIREPIGTAVPALVERLLGASSER
ncbi:SIR2 family NAD-dependent protein deacylase [Nonomuraea sp. NPDC050328]|uniref:SIR2 family NAD-dependent protein deacylase n=1 Tax=Nonomuraea sp. NPDC050328 TaxID=3364361 RepID=UPI0037BC751E